MDIVNCINQKHQSPCTSIAMHQDVKGKGFSLAWKGSQSLRHTHVGGWGCVGVTA